MGEKQEGGGSVESGVGEGSGGNLKNLNFKFRVELYKTGGKASLRHKLSFSSTGL
jgi:hypothetical protein